MPSNRLLDEPPRSLPAEIAVVNGNGFGHMAPTEPGFGFGDVFRATVRHKWMAATFFCATTVLTAFAVVNWPKTYRSEAKLYLRVGRESVGLDSTAALSRGMVGLQVTREEELNTVVELLRSRAMLEEIVDAVGPEAILDPVPALASKGQPSLIGELKATFQQWTARLTNDIPLSRRERAINALQKQLDVQNVRKTDVINVTHDGRDPEISQRIVSSLLRACLVQHVQINHTPGSYTFLNDKTAAVKADLDRTENELRKLKNESKLGSPVEQRQALVNQISHLEGELQTSIAATVAAEAENRELSKELVQVSPVEELSKSTGNTNFAADGIRQQLYGLQLKEKELASRVTERHVELQSVRAQIAAATPILEALEPTRTQTTSGRNHVYDELRLAYLKQVAAIQSHRTRSTTLRSQLVDANHRLQVLNDNELRIAQLKRDADILDASYRRYAESREQARLEESLGQARISNLTVAQPASLSRQPVRPQRSLILMAGVLAGCLGGICLSVAADQFQARRKASDGLHKPHRRPTLDAPST